MQTKHYFLTLLALFFILKVQAQNVDVKDFQKFEIKNTSIRAIQVVNDSTIWFAGSNGKYGRIINNKIELDSITFEDKKINFRSIAFNGESIFILSIENPAVLYKINPLGEKLELPKIVYQENHKSIFYDAMAFFDTKNGIAMGDPTSNCLSVILTNDGGKTWKKLPCDSLPNIHVGEAAFAASNTNIAISGKNAWLATGGKKARVFYSNNLGLNWNVVETPITQGGKMTGIYTIDFYDDNNGIIMGGNWEEKSSTYATKALTNNGGKTWSLISKNQLPGYISCVQYAPNSKGERIVAVSTEGIYYSENKGELWHKISDKSYYSIQFIDKNTAWLSGNNKIAKIQLQYH